MTAGAAKGAARADRAADRRASSGRTGCAVAVVLVTIVVTSLLGLVNPYLLKLLIDVAIPQQDFALLDALRRR